jgi:hypothetical protein
MSRVSSPNPIKGIKIKCSRRRLRTLNGFKTHEALWKIQSTESQDNPSICVPYYAWSGFGGLISATFLHATSFLSPVLEKSPG